MEEPVDTQGSAATPPTGADARVEQPGDGAADGRNAADGRRPGWWHSQHPVFVPLAGFFTGMIYIILIPGAYGAILQSLVGYERAEELFPYVLVALVVPIALIVPRRTRRFGRYMLFGVLATTIVVVGVAVLVLYFLIRRDS